MGVNFIARSPFIPILTQEAQKGNLRFVDKKKTEFTSVFLDDQILSITSAAMTPAKASHCCFASRSLKKSTPLKVTTSMVDTL